jgi:hypothetical protein
MNHSLLKVKTVTRLFISCRTCNSINISLPDGFEHEVTIAGECPNTKEQR